MKMPKIPEDLSFYLNQRFVCDCGKEHYAPLRAVRVGSGVLDELPSIIRLMGYQSLYLISDPVTYQIAGERCVHILENAGIPHKITKLTHLGFDEATLGELTIQMPKDCDLVIAVGTGAINDVNGIAQAVKAINSRALFHSDGVQAFGKIPFQF